MKHLLPAIPFEFVKLNAQNNQGKTPLDDNDQVAEELKSKGAVA